MGSYNKWRIDVNIGYNPPGVTASVTQAHLDLIENVREAGRRLDHYGSSPTWDQFAFRKWCERTKWDPCDLLKTLSKQFPALIFSAEYSGDYGAGKIFFHDGIDIEAHDIWQNPKFPSIPLLKKSIVRRNKAYEAARAQQEKERIAKEAAAKEAQIKKLEAELAQLKAAQQTTNSQC